MKKNFGIKSEFYVQRYNLIILMFLVILVIVFTFALSTIITNAAVNTIRERIAYLTYSNTSQQVLNIDNYLKKLKDTTSLFFSDEIYYTYDATSEDIDDFEKIQTENRILTKIEELSVLESYADFSVIYANSRKIGWISDGTYNIGTGSELYQIFSNQINDKKNNAAWFASENDNYDKLYYIKRLNENAILVTSIYSREIETIFTVPNDMQNMAIRLVDENSIVLYSTDKEEIGQTLSENIDSIIKGKRNYMILNDDYLVTSNSCSNGWKVVCSIPADDILKDINNLKSFIYAISVLLLCIVISIIYAALKILSSPVNKIMKNLKQKADYDQLTKLLNKISFQSMSTAVIETGSKNNNDIFIMLDMDNFKKINDTLGHDKGDEVLIRFSKILLDTFTDDYLIGRLGGDEFAVYRQISKKSINDTKRIIQADIDILRDKFKKEFEQEYNECGLSISIGIAIIENGKMNFEKIYKAADTALYSSKNSGKNRYSYYSGDN